MKPDTFKDDSLDLDLNAVVEYLLHCKESEESNQAHQVDSQDNKASEKTDVLSLGKKHEQGKL